MEGTSREGMGDWRWERRLDTEPRPYTDRNRTGECLTSGKSFSGSEVFLPWDWVSSTKKRTELSKTHLSQHYIISWFGQRRR